MLPPTVTPGSGRSPSPILGTLGAGRSNKQRAHTTLLQSLLYDGSTALLCQPKYPFCDKTLDHPLTRRMCLCVSKQQNFCQVRLTSSGKEDIDDDVKKILDFKYNYAVILGHYLCSSKY